MALHKWIAILSALLPCVASAVKSGSKVEGARQAVTRSLPYLETEGVWWKNNKRCVTCHQIAFMTWTINEAACHGLPVDEAKRTQWNEWSIKGTFGAKMYFKLTDSSFKDLEKAKMQAEEIAKLKPLANKDFRTKKEFEQVLKELLPPDVETRHHDAIIKTAQPASGSGGSDVYNVMLRAGVVANIASGDEVRSALLEGMVHFQRKDGLWDGEGQFHGMKRPHPETDQIATMWDLLALSSVNPLPQHIAEARARGRQALGKQKLGQTVESLTLRLMLAFEESNSDVSRDMLEQLTALQRSDGGWAAFTENPSSDAFTTGQVLYALGKIGRTSADPIVEKAWAYLLGSQEADGSWRVDWHAFNKENNKDHTLRHKVFSYWGTAWADLGLMQTLPK